MSSTQFLVTRPTVAALLSSNGITLTPTENPYKAKYLAWLVEATPEAIQIVADYYAEIGKPVPKAVQALQDLIKGGAEL